MSIQAIKVHHLSDTSFDKEATERYRLSVHIRPESFSFSVIDNDLHKIIVLNSYELPADQKDTNGNLHTLTDAINQVLNENEWLRKPFKNVFVCWEDKYYTLVPSDLFIKGSRKKYLSFTQDLKDQESLTLKDEYIEKLDSRLIFSIPGKILDLVNRYYPDCILRSHMGVLIEHLPVSSPPEGAGTMHVNIRQNSIDILMFRSTKLLMANAYDYKTPEDILYFINFISGQYRDSLQGLEIGLTGEVEENTLVHRMLEDYLPGLKFTGISKYSVSTILEKVPKHMYFIPFNIFV